MHFPIAFFFLLVSAAYAPVPVRTRYEDRHTRTKNLYVAVALPLTAIVVFFILLIVKLVYERRGIQYKEFQNEEEREVLPLNSACYHVPTQAVRNYNAI